MKIRIAFAGEMSKNQCLSSQIDPLFAQIKGYFCKDISNVETQILVSPYYTGKEWINWCKTQDCSLCVYNLQDGSDYPEPCSHMIIEDTPLRNLLGESICEKADVIIVAWSEDMTELSGATWELIQLAHSRKVPCIWISTKSQNIYCLWDSYYKEYKQDYLEAVSVPLCEEELQPTISSGYKNSWFYFWEKCRSNYLSKYKADISKHPVEADFLLKQEYKLEKEASDGEGLRQILLKKFYQFDEAAIDSNSRYQTLIYQRSILPFIATIFLAVGFYVETLFGTTVSILAPALELPATIITLTLAGLGFFIHGLLNLYTYRLSKDPQVQQWQKDYIDNRYVAEILRILLHFLPYGATINMRKYCDGDLKLYSCLKHSTDNAEPEMQKISKKNMQNILRHMKELLDDQLTYHKSSVNRYEKIVTSLECWGNRIMFIGLAVVIGRGLLQFLLVLLKVAQEMKNTEIINSSMISIIRSFLNMLALLLPAWAGYFATKALQNNFRYNLDNHHKMIGRLSPIREKVIRSMEREDIFIEVIYAMIDELSETMLQHDSLNWHHQYMKATIKPL